MRTLDVVLFFAVRKEILAPPLHAVAPPCPFQCLGAFMQVVLLFWRANRPSLVIGWGWGKCGLLRSEDEVGEEI